MSESWMMTILFGCAIAGVFVLAHIANQLEKIARALERIANRDH
jgi:outer membrane lipoprotein-sorting protein